MPTPTSSPKSKRPPSESEEDLATPRRGPKRAARQIIKYDYSDSEEPSNYEMEACSDGDEEDDYQPTNTQEEEDGMLFAVPEIGEPVKTSFAVEISKRDDLEELFSKEDFE